MSIAVSSVACLLGSLTSSLGKGYGQWPGECENVSGAHSYVRRSSCCVCVCGCRGGGGERSFSNHPYTPKKERCIYLPIWFGTLKGTQSEMLLDMFKCTTGLSESLIGAESTNTLVDDGVTGAESPEHFSRNRDPLIRPFLALYYCIEGIEKLHVDRFVKPP
jgi:hypothetical protein